LTNIYQIWIPHKNKVILASNVLFDEDKFYNRKLIQFTDTLISKLDEVIVKVSIALNRDLDDVQLREDSDIEDVKDIQDINNIDKVERILEREKEQEPIENDSESVLYPILELTIESSFFT
jgi:hypothetical protein